MKEINGFENYLITENGEIFSKSLNRFLKQSTDKQGYKHIRLFNKNGRPSVFVHRLVAMTYLKNSQNKPYVNHKDANKSNNHISNLEWCTAKENSAHALKNNLNKHLFTSYLKANESVSKKVYDKINNVTYKSINYASKELNIPFTSLRRLINNSNRFVIL